MQFHLLLALATYFALLIFIGIKATHKQHNATDYLLGGRGMNYWVTAISACASDMSIWLFMGLPVAVFTQGMLQAWVAIGLILFMFLSWQYLAPKLRTETERLGAITLASYLEKRFEDKTGTLQLASAALLLFYLTIYISAGLIGLGGLFESLFGIPYLLGCMLGLLAIFAYALMGGFSAIAWTDFFQGLFLLASVILVPALALSASGGWTAVEAAASLKNVNLQLVPDLSGPTLLLILNVAVGWGFGYFGQPHIINKFMAISDPKDLKKAKWISFFWQTLALGSSVMIGLASLAYYFSRAPSNQELIFVDMVTHLFHPYFGGLILCSILAATISTIDSQIIVVASVLAEDVYKKVWKKEASELQILTISRYCVLFIAACALMVAAIRPASIFAVVEYAWLGLGSAFAPVLLVSLYSKRITREGALYGMLTGGIVSAVWKALGTPVSAMFPGAILSLLVIWLYSSKASKPQSSKIR